mmetsp:Transcript_34464/g.87110  ORF Transcript_34464/g.87110 Transcript_34464/m.87110 type:complete len:201 (+) Transcript_34464:2202-2804(+)
MAQPRQAHDVLRAAGRGGDQRQWHLVPQSHRGHQRGEDRDALPAERRQPRADRRDHAVRGAARARGERDDAQRHHAPGPVPRHRGVERGRVPGARKGRDRAVMRALQRAAVHRVPGRPAPPQCGAHARALRPGHPGQPARAEPAAAVERAAHALQGVRRAGGGAAQQPEAQHGAAGAPTQDIRPLVLWCWRAHNQSLPAT